VAQPATLAFSLNLTRRAQREMEDLDGVPTPQRFEADAVRVVVPGLDRHVEPGAMRDLLMSMKDRRLVTWMRRLAQTNRHALCEETIVGRPRNEVPPAPTDDPVALGHEAENILERTRPRPPELIRIRIDDPVCLEVGGGEPRHPRDPFPLPHVVAWLADQVETAQPRVALQYLGGPV